VGEDNLHFQDSVCGFVVMNCKWKETHAKRHLDMRHSAANLWTRGRKSAYPRHVRRPPEKLKLSVDL
jgi:hypothetical protein